MFQLKQKILNYARDTKRLSKLILTSLLLIGFVATISQATWNFLAEQTSARLLQTKFDEPVYPYLFGTINQSQGDLLETYFENSAVQKSQLELTYKRNCQLVRTSQTNPDPTQAPFPTRGDQFLNQFEESFSGVLPGIGRVLLENSGTVSERREMLIYQVMQFYANLKFCISAADFEENYPDYDRLIGALGIFLQVRAGETVTQARQSGLNIPVANINERLDYPSLYAAQDLLKVIKDLKSTQEYVTSLIDRAIQSAIDLDHETDLRLALLSTQTQNQLLATNNGLTDASNLIGNLNLFFDDAALNRIERNRNLNACILHIIQKKEIGPGCEILLTDNVHSDIPKNIPAIIAPPPEPEQNLLELKPEIITHLNDLSYGLLNLLPETTQQNFLQQRFPSAYLLWVGAINQKNPLYPGEEEHNIPILIKTIQNSFQSELYELEICHTINPQNPQKICYDQNLVQTGLSEANLENIERSTLENQRLI